MAGVPDEVKTYLTGQGVTTPMYVGEVPSTPDRVIVLNEYSGPEPELTVQQNSKMLESPGLQARCRGTYDQARSDARAVYSKLHGLVEQTLSGSRYLLIRATTTPYSLGKDERGRTEYVVSFLCLREVE